MTPPLPAVKLPSRFIRRGGIHPSRPLPAAAKTATAARGLATPTTPLKIRAQGKILPPLRGVGDAAPLQSLPQTTRLSSHPAPPLFFAYSLQTLPFPHKTGDIFAKALPRLYRTMVDTRPEMRYNGLASGEALRNAQTIPHKFGKKGEYTHMKRKSAIAAVTAAALALSLAACGSSDSAAASSAAPVESTASSEAARRRLPRR